MIRLIPKTHIDFEGKRHFWMSVSALLVLASFVSVILHKGLHYSIDFTGGLSIVLRSSSTTGQGALGEEPIRRSLDRIGLAGSEVKTSRSEQGEDLLIHIQNEGQFKSPEALIRAKLDEIYPDQWHVVPDEKLNTGELEQLRGISYVAVATKLSQDQLTQAIKNVQIDNARILPHRTETGEDVWILAGEGRDAASRLRKALAVDYPTYNFEVRSIEMVGPRIGSELRSKAILASIASWGLIILYLWWRYDLVFGIAAVIALIHDAVITIGVLSMFDYEFSMTVVGAILTLIGFSVNDTIVVFDRIRENLKRSREKTLKEVINDSINQTLSRTIITSGTVFLVIVVLFFNGGEVLHGFAFAMLFGTIIGTYSSIYIAAPILIDYAEWSGRPIAKKMKNK